FRAGQDDHDRECKAQMAELTPDDVAQLCNELFDALTLGHMLVSVYGFVVRHAREFWDAASLPGRRQSDSVVVQTAAAKRNFLEHFDRGGGPLGSLDDEDVEYTVNVLEALSRAGSPELCPTVIGLMQALEAALPEYAELVT